jgi:hypothetical protein
VAEMFTVVVLIKIVFGPQSSVVSSIHGVRRSS